MRELEQAVKALTKSQRSALPRTAQAGDAAESGDAIRFRFSAKGLASNRQRLGLLAADFGLLIGTTGQSIYA